MSLVAWVALTLAGGLGSAARYTLDRAIVVATAEPFPFGILVVNVLGAFALGLLTTWSSPHAALWVAEVGFVGTFTTFSTWMLDAQRLFAEGRHRAAAVNVAGSLVVGVAAAALGRAVGGLF